MVLSTYSNVEHLCFHINISLETIFVVLKIFSSLCESLSHSIKRSNHLTNQENLLDLCFSCIVTHNEQFFLKKTENTVYEEGFSGQRGVRNCMKTTAIVLWKICANF